MLTEKLRIIAGQLSSGPAILGEDHSRPDARAALVDLLQAGKVRELFVELPSIEMSDLDPSVLPAGPLSRTVSGHLRQTAGQDPAPDPIWQAVVQGLGDVERRWRNPILLSDVIQNAQIAGVQVFFHDNAEPSGPLSQRLARRNERAGDEFLTRGASPDRAGAVVLVGADHLDPMQSHGSSMQRHCGVQEVRVHDLSRL